MLGSEADPEEPGTNTALHSSADVPNRGRTADSVSRAGSLEAVPDDEAPYPGKRKAYLVPACGRTKIRGAMTSLRHLWTSDPARLLRAALASLMVFAFAFSVISSETATALSSIQSDGLLLVASGPGSCKLGRPSGCRNPASCPVRMSPFDAGRAGRVRTGPDGSHDRLSRPDRAARDRRPAHQRSVDDALILHANIRGPRY